MATRLLLHIEGVRQGQRWNAQAKSDLQQILGTSVSAYINMDGNLGGYVPDGNVLLAKEDILSHVAQAVIDAGMGEWVEVDELSDEQMAVRCGIRATVPGGDEAPTQGGYAHWLQSLAKSRGLQWCHYGLYGNSFPISYWMVIK